VPLSLAPTRSYCGPRSPLKRKGSVSDAQCAGAAFSRFFDVTIHVVYAGKRMEDLSMGERAIVLLRVLLALGDYPLLIDQPEEHLDNRVVFDDLTLAFREAKGKRQIIITTHNTNLVVNTDAEQVLVAQDKGGVLTYTLGTLKDLAIRSAITTILEGGDEPFKTREQRYGYVY
jgi:ABC-type cobalamin/Fe3+-siderophores transport system ATPase subunit